jgi:hypothetical protein
LQKFLSQLAKRNGEKRLQNLSGGPADGKIEIPLEKI